jgi:hypothetical protein
MSLHTTKTFNVSGRWTAAYSPAIPAPIINTSYGCFTLLLSAGIWYRYFTQKRYNTPMKTIRSVLESLSQQAPFRTLTRHRCYQHYLALLPKRFRDAIGFVYVRNGVLHLALRHPGYKMELNYNQELLRSLLDTLIDAQPECTDLRANKVVLFVSKYARITVKDSPTIPYYDERSDGTFEVHTRNPDLHRQFQRLREAIRANRRHD